MQNTTWYKITNIEKSIKDKTEIRELIARKLKIIPSEIVETILFRESLDARNKRNLKFIYTAIFRLRDDKTKIRHKSLSLYEPPKPPELTSFLELSLRPVIVGTGPAGLFAALALVEKGYRPVIFERGNRVAQRIKDVRELWNHRKMNGNSNVQFGEGGAGTFSDGKLTARNQDYFTGQVLNRLVRFGAPEEILYKQRPHIGTDQLRLIVPRIREFLISAGAEFHFGKSVTRIEVKNGEITGIRFNDESLETSSLILAIGHSSRDTYTALNRAGVHLEAKPFAIGVRIEHPHSFIDRAQYGKHCDFSITGAADYKLTYNWTAGNRGVYSFCMCPGGEVVLSASGANQVVTNGMSNFARNARFSNAGLVVTVKPDDYPDGALAGVQFQEEIEQRAFRLGNGVFDAPAQTALDFVKNRPGDSLKKSSFRPGLAAVEMTRILPQFICDALKAGLQAFERRIPGFINEGLLIAPETRTSAPVRILRDPDSFESVNIRGLFPIGEGAGYAGGIVSSAADGLKLGFRAKAV